MHLPLPTRRPAVRHAFIRVVLALLFATLGFLAYGVWQAYRVYDDVKHTVYVVPTSTLEPTVVPSSFNGNRRINILVLGSDNDKKKEEARPLSQSMIVVTVDPVHDNVSMLSIPRDFWVPIHGHGWGKIDLAYKYGGVQLARETVENLFHIGINYYAWVGLDGFIKVIDTFNGVTLDVSHPILDDTYPNDLNSHNPYGYKRVFIPAGWQHMMGDQALEYVRSRHGDAIGDFGRSARQQQVLLQLKAKATVFNVLRNLVQVAHELRSSVRTDVKPTDYLAIERLSRHIAPQNIRQVVLAYPTYCKYAFTPDGQSILSPYWSKIRAVTRPLFAPIQQPRPPRQAKKQVVRAVPTSTPSNRPAPTPGPAPSPTATPSPSPTPAAPSMSRLPGTLLFVKRGNLFKLHGQTVQQLTYTGDVAMPMPAPRGGTVAVVRFPTFGYSSDIWLLNVRNGRRMTRLTRGIDPGHDIRNNLWAAWPSWSSDGSRLVFSWDRAKLAAAPSEIRPVDLGLWALPTRGGLPVQLSSPAQGAGGDTEPAWRPGSSQIAYVHWDYIQATNQPYSQLYLLDSRGASKPAALTPVGGRVLDPQWDRRGRRLVFVRETNGIDEITVAPLQETAKGPRLGGRTVLARGRVGQPAFSPDGRWVSFVRAQQDGFALYVAPASGGKPLQVQALGGSLDGRWRPVWLP